MGLAATILRRWSRRRSHSRPKAAATMIPGPREWPKCPRHPQQTGRRPRKLQQGGPWWPGGKMSCRRCVQLQRGRQHPRFQHHYNNNNNSNNNIAHTTKRTLCYPLNGWRFTEIDEGSWRRMGRCCVDTPSNALLEHWSHAFLFDEVIRGLSAALFIICGGWFLAFYYYFVMDALVYDGGGVGRDKGGDLWLIRLSVFCVEVCVCVIGA